MTIEAPGIGRHGRPGGLNNCGQPRIIGSRILFKGRPYKSEAGPEKNLFLPNAPPPLVPLRFRSADSQVKLVPLAPKEFFLVWCHDGGVDPSLSGLPIQSCSRRGGGQAFTAISGVNFQQRTETDGLRNSSADQKKSSFWLFWHPPPIGEVGICRFFFRRLAYSTELNPPKLPPWEVGSLTLPALLRPISRPSALSPGCGVGQGVASFEHGTG